MFTAVLVNDAANTLSPTFGKIAVVQRKCWRFYCRLNHLLVMPMANVLRGVYTTFIFLIMASVAQHMQ